MTVCEMNELRRKIFKTANNTYEDFPIGKKVQIICVACDFTFFSGEETGVVVRNSKQYLGVIVKFDEPIHYESGHVMTEFNFKPSDLKSIEELEKENPREVYKHVIQQIKETRSKL